MPTEKPPRLNLTLNENDIKRLNKIREDWTKKNKTATYSYVDIVRELIASYKPV